MLSICGTGKASKRFLSALLNNKGGGCYVKKDLMSMSITSTAVRRSGVEAESQQVKIDRRREKTDRFEVSEGHELHNVSEDRLALRRA